MILSIHFLVQITQMLFQSLFQCRSSLQLIGLTPETIVYWLNWLTKLSCHFISVHLINLISQFMDQSLIFFQFKHSNIYIYITKYIYDFTMWISLHTYRQLWCKNPSECSHVINSGPKSKSCLNVSRYKMSNQVAGICKTNDIIPFLKLEIIYLSHSCNLLTKWSQGILTGCMKSFPLQFTQVEYP